jgi:hypothetical protein
MGYDLQFVRFWAIFKLQILDCLCSRMLTHMTKKQTPIVIRWAPFCELLKKSYHDLRGLIQHIP